MSESLTIEDFNNQTTVRIVKFLRYTSDTDIQMINISFEVRINSNNRVGIFISDMELDSIENSANDHELVDIAWGQLKQHVNDWSVINFAHEQFTIFNVQVTTDAITIEDFNTNFTVNLARYELYPKVNPDWWCIAFIISKNSNPQTNIYVEGQVPTTIWCNNVPCVALASSVWDLVKERACVWAADNLSKPVVLDTFFTPSEI